ncbi:MAG TPA: hypothetical protein VM553_16365, partial [Dongiaceae bacterium]|nr:hypothetical protein [Dongiaceae bacterium]
SQEQRAGLNQINSAINELTKTTQTNASASEQLSATAEEMSSQALQLQSVMQFFRTDTPSNAPVNLSVVGRSSGRGGRGQDMAQASDVNEKSFVNF